MTPITRKVERPIFISWLSGSAPAKSRLRISEPMTQTRRFACTSKGVRKRPASGTEVETSICLSVVPMTSTLSMVSEAYLTARWVWVVGLMAVACGNLLSRRSTSRRLTGGRLRNSKKLPRMIHGMRET